MKITLCFRQRMEALFRAVFLPVIQEEEAILENKPVEEEKKKTFSGFAERRSK